MAARRRHVDLLADIYRRLALIYNVTNYVAVGTNQILKLVYSLSQELLLRADQPDASTVQSAKGAPMGTNVKMNLTSRITNWMEVFVYYPRAYLLISTSVDYSLSVGRLPHDNDIPEFLRNILPGTPKITLPWMAKTDLINPTNVAGPDFWCPSYCAPARPLSLIRPQNDGLSLPGSAGSGSMVGTCKPPLQLQTMPGALWQDGTGYDNMHNYQTTPVTFEQGPINLDMMNPMPPTPVPFFQPSASQTLGYGQYGQIGAIPTPVMGSEMGGSGDLGQVYMTDDDNIAPNLWVLDYYNETASNGPSMLYSLTYPPPPHYPNDDQAQGHGGLV